MTRHAVTPIGTRRSKVIDLARRIGHPTAAVSRIPQVKIVSRLDRTEAEPVHPINEVGDDLSAWERAGVTRSTRIGRHVEASESCASCTTALATFTVQFRDGTETKVCPGCMPAGPVLITEGS